MPAERKALGNWIKNTICDVAPCLSPETALPPPRFLLSILLLQPCPVFVRLSEAEQTNTRGPGRGRRRDVGLFGKESFLKRRAEVCSSTERPQNKYLPPLCLQRLRPVLLGPEARVWTTLGSDSLMLGLFVKKL